MAVPGEHKTVQARILAYAQAIGWSFVSREEAEQRRGFDAPSPKGSGGTSSDVPSPTVPGTILSSSTTCSTPRYVNSIRATAFRIPGFPILQFDRLLGSLVALLVGYFNR